MSARNFPSPPPSISAGPRSPHASTQACSPAAAANGERSLQRWRDEHGDNDTEMGNDSAAELEAHIRQLIALSWPADSDPPASIDIATERQPLGAEALRFVAHHSDVLTLVNPFPHSTHSSPASAPGTTPAPSTAQSRPAHGEGAAASTYHSSPPHAYATDPVLASTTKACNEEASPQDQGLALQGSSDGHGCVAGQGVERLLQHTHTHTTHMPVPCDTHGHGLVELAMCALASATCTVPACVCTCHDETLQALPAAVRASLGRCDEDKHGMLWGTTATVTSRIEATRLLSNDGDEDCAPLPTLASGPAARAAAGPGVSMNPREQTPGPRCGAEQASSRHPLSACVDDGHSKASMINQAWQAAQSSPSSTPATTFVQGARVGETATVVRLLQARGMALLAAGWPFAATREWTRSVMHRTVASHMACLGEAANDASLAAGAKAEVGPQRHPHQQAPSVAHVVSESLQPPTRAIGASHTGLHILFRPACSSNARFPRPDRGALSVRLELPGMLGRAIHLFQSPLDAARVALLSPDNHNGAAGDGRVRVYACIVALGKVYECDRDIDAACGVSSALLKAPSGFDSVCKNVGSPQPVEASALAPAPQAGAAWRGRVFAVYETERVLAAFLVTFPPPPSLVSECARDVLAQPTPSTFKVPASMRTFFVELLSRAPNPAHTAQLQLLISGLLRLHLSAHDFVVGISQCLCAAAPAGLQQSLELHLAHVRRSAE